VVRVHVAEGHAVAEGGPWVSAEDRARSEAIVADRNRA